MWFEGGKEAVIEVHKRSYVDLVNMFHARMISRT
jgi:hypothetical protein